MSFWYITFPRSDDNASVSVQGRQRGRGLLRRERRRLLGAAQVLGVRAAEGGGGLQDLRRRHQGRPAPGIDHRTVEHRDPQEISAFSLGMG